MAISDRVQRRAVAHERRRPRQPRVPTQSRRPPEPATTRPAKVGATTALPDILIPGNDPPTSSVRTLTAVAWGPPAAWLGRLAPDGVAAPGTPAGGVSAGVGVPWPAGALGALSGSRTRSDGGGAVDITVAGQTLSQPCATMGTAVATGPRRPPAAETSLGTEVLARSPVPAIRPARLPGDAAIAVAWDGRLPDREGRRTMQPRQVATAVGVALGLALLLNASSLQAGVEASPFGLSRDVGLAVLRPVTSGAHALYLDRPREWLDRLAGHTVGDPGGGGLAPAPQTGGDLAPVATAPDGTAVPDSTMGGGSAPRAGDASRRSSRAIAASNAAAHPAPPPGPVVWGPPPTPQQPLRLWVGGDSVAGYFSAGMDGAASDSGLVASHSHYKESTGLARPDYFDWPAQLEQDMQHYEPRVVVFLVGANDDQPLLVSGAGVAAFGSDAWKAEYARRVAAVMDRLHAEGRSVVWVGEPVMRSTELDAHMQRIAGVQRTVAAVRPWVEFVDSRPLLSDGGGGYVPYVSDATGQQVLIRAPDGIHLTPSGGRRLADAVLARVMVHFAATPVAPPPAAAATGGSSGDSSAAGATGVDARGDAGGGDAGWSYVGGPV